MSAAGLASSLPSNVAPKTVHVTIVAGFACRSGFSATTDCIRRVSPPPHGRETHWRTPEPLPANELVKELLDPGCHTTDIGDAFFAAYPDWIDDTNA